jgi:hypothetical protein
MSLYLFVGLMVVVSGLIVWYATKQNDQGGEVGDTHNFDDANDGDSDGGGDGGE